MDDIQISHAGNTSLVFTKAGVYSFETGASLAPYSQKMKTIEIDKQSVNVGDYKVIPFGNNNDMPQEIAKLISDNNLTPKILQRQAMLLWGQGPRLYSEKFEDGTITRYWDEHPDVQKWLNDWDYESYLQKAVVEYRHMNGHFTLYRRNKGARIGMSSKIVDLVHKSSVKCRLQWHESWEPLSGIIVGDYEKSTINPMYFPVFDRMDPFRYPLSMNYSNLPSFALDGDYSLPDFWGNRNWITLASSIAILLSNFNENSAAIKYHIKVPAIYWEAKKRELEEKCIRDNIKYKDSMLQKIKDDEFKKFTEALSNVKNVGKLITTDELFDADSNQYVGWKIDPLDQKVKDYIDGQINISKRAALETSSGLGLHPALSNISTDGNLPSGSEQLYAFKLYLLTDINIPESIICRDINNAIRANFPGINVKLGFYHDAVITEAQTSPDKRIKNQTGSQN